jgi:hypothetical protein
VCGRGPQERLIDGQVLHAQFTCDPSRPESACSYMLNAVLVTPGWVAKAHGGKGEWLQHRVVTRLEFNFFNGSQLAADPFFVDTHSIHGPVPATLSGKILASRVDVIILHTGRATGCAAANDRFVAGVKVFFVAARPDDSDVAAIGHRIDNQRAAAGQFAADFVAAVLTTPATKHAALQRVITLPESEWLPHAAASASLPPTVINTPKVWSVVPEGSAGDVDLYSATVVVVQQRPYASAEPSRAFYRAPVLIWQFQPWAMDWPGAGQ